MWTVRLTVEIKLHFRDGLVWTVDLTVEIKLYFREGLVWTVGLTVEIKLCFPFHPMQCFNILNRRLILFSFSFFFTSNNKLISNKIFSPFFESQ